MIAGYKGIAKNLGRIQEYQKQHTQQVVKSGGEEKSRMEKCGKNETSAKRASGKIR